MVIGVLSANPEGPLFRRAMRDLQELAAVPPSQTDRTFLPQVHAMNTLKAIFSSSVLGDASDEYVPDCLVLASTSLTSVVWAIRNCGLMLFRALVDRLLGTLESHNSTDSTTRKQVRFSWNQHPELEAALRRLIDSGISGSDSPSRAIEGVFPALKMIQSIPPTPSSRDYFCEAMLKLCCSSHWHVRDVAARTYCNLTEGDDLLATMRSVLHCDGTSQNDMHGRLFCVYYLVRDLVSRNDLTLSESIYMFREI
jgi:hypothetical protein